MDTAPPLSQLQAVINAWAARYWGGSYWPPHANLARLAEEVGEIARAVNQAYGPKRVKSPNDLPALGEELADALFALICLANSAQVDLQASWDVTLAKYRARDEAERVEPTS